MPEQTKKIAVKELDQLEGEALLEQMIGTGIKPRDDQGRQRAQELLKTFVSELLDPSFVVKKGVTRTINARIAAIDELLSKQVNEILHHPDFQRLEASWRGLHKLVMGSETGEGLKIRVFNATKKELLNDFQAASEFTESAFWKKVYQFEFGQYGGDPYGALIGDYEFDKGMQDVELITHLSKVSAASHAPLITASAPQMFGMDSFTQMPDPRDLAKIFDKENADNTKWLSFRDTEDSRFIVMVLPHTLRRVPYSPEKNPVDAFDFRETTPEHDDFCWGNAAYDYALRLTDAFAKHHWCVAIRGPEGGGLVSDLPIHTYTTADGDVAAKCPTEVQIPDDREFELSNLGFIGLLHCKNTDYAAFFGERSANRPKKYNTKEATANADLSSQIPFLMATSRIAHYLKVICRDKIGSFMSRDDCAKFLNRWVSDLVLDNPDATAEAKAKRPLRAARIDVIEDKAKPGCYQAIAFLQPHFQLNTLGVSLRLVADLPPAVK